MKQVAYAGLLVTPLMQLGCIDTGQSRVSVQLEVAGTALDGAVAGRDGFLIELTSAELAFGPFYLCAGALAGDNCDVARLEWLDSVVVNVLEPAAASAGALSGVSGPVRSAMYDLGIASLLTEPEPIQLAAAEALSGNSVRLAGVAARDAETLSFEIELPIQLGGDSEIGVSMVRVSSAASLVRDVRGDEQALLVRFDARPWVRDIDFQSALASAPESGALLKFSAESQAHRAVRAALLSGERPSFEWSAEP